MLVGDEGRSVGWFYQDCIYVVLTQPLKDLGKSARESLDIGLSKGIVCAHLPNNKVRLDLRHEGGEAINGICRDVTR